MVPARAIDVFVPLSVSVTPPLLLVAKPPAPTEIVSLHDALPIYSEAGLLVVLVIETAVAVSVSVTAAVVLSDIVCADVVRLAILPARADVFTRLNVPAVVRAPDD